MKPSPGQLIALKAVLLGHAAALNPLRKRDAHSMVNTAITQLNRVEDKARLLQLAFYHLVRAELHRVGGDPVPDRHAAQRISKRIRSDLFKSFMDLERRTEPLLDKRPPSQDDPHPQDPPLTPWSATVSHWSLSQQQEYFVYKASLAEILAAHGVSRPDA